MAFVALLGSSLAKASPVPQNADASYDDGSGQPPTGCEESSSSSPFIPVDSWIYPAVWRLYALGFVNHVYLDIRPWTRVSLRNILNDTDTMISNSDQGRTADEARRISEALNRELQRDLSTSCFGHRDNVVLDSAYSVARGIGGTPLHDSFHLGQTIVNDFGRPYERGFNFYSGVSGYLTSGRFTLYLRGEFQGAPSASGYSAAMVQTLATIDGTVNPVTGLSYPDQATIPAGPIDAVTRANFLEAYVSAQIAHHVISFGKQDEWLGPAQGASMAYSNNAENIYALQINRIEPLYIPYLSRLTGPFRYEFLVGPLRGHALMPNPRYSGNLAAEPNVISAGDPWMHVEKISFQPTKNVEFGFERTVLFGGEGHSPVTLHSFLKSFFSTANVGQTEKDGPNDPGARFASFDFSYRIPFMRNWLTLYADSEVHDDVSPVDAPRHAAVRPGMYLSHLPGISKLDFRVEGASSDPPSARSVGGSYMYFESIEKQGYTNHGQIFGDWIGRESKGGDAWLTYHLSGNEWIQGAWRHQKAAKDFVIGGTTLNDLSLQVVKRVGRDLEIRGTATLEYWKAPIYLPGWHTVTATTIQVTWFPNIGEIRGSL